MNRPYIYSAIYPAFLRLPVALPVVLTMAIALPGHANETEPNDTFGDRQVLPAETTTIQGELTNQFDPDEFDYSFSGTMTPGSAEAYDITDVSPAEPFYAWINNGTTGPDTVMGLFSEEDVLLTSDDDSSPVGSGVASAVGGVVNPDGTIHLAVSGFPDFEFTGLDPDSGVVHQESGDFEVRVKMGMDAPQGDVDYYTFTDLTPGTAFEIEVTEAPFDTTLAWLDDNGDIIYVDDDGGQELLSRVRGYVPLSGNVSVALTAFGDVEFIGQHIESGAYTLTLTQP
jgi:hypothetical protein